VGKYEETLVIDVSSPAARVLKLPVHLFVKPDLYATPDVADFGPVSLALIRGPGRSQELLNQTILVTSRRDQFSIVSIVCDVPAVTVRQTPTGGPSRTFQVDVSLNQQRLVRGPLRGSIAVRTSDPDLPELRIPIQSDVR